AAIIVREMGKPVEQALMEVDFAAEIYGFYADNADELMADEGGKHFAGDGTAIVRRSAFGTLLGIMPWNFPYYQVARFAGPNLVIGNPILLKHAPQCPESAAAIQRIYDDAGFPAGAYQNIYATNDQIEWVIGDPRVHGVSVTGSERAGAAVAEKAAEARLDNTGQSCNAAKRFIVTEDLYDDFLAKFKEQVEGAKPGD